MTKTLNILAADLQRGDKIVTKGRENRTRTLEVTMVDRSGDRVPTTVRVGGGWEGRTFAADQQLTVRRGA